MDDARPAPRGDLTTKIARLVEEKGWNQEDFARIANLNRHTVRLILKSDGARNLRNATVSQCSAALGLSVSELRTLPLEKLLPRMHGRHAEGDEDLARGLLRQAVQPDLVAWVERNGERAEQMHPDEVRELLTLQGVDSPFPRLGVEQFVERIERRRRLMAQVRAIAATDYMPLMEQMIGLVYEKATKGRA